MIVRDLCASFDITFKEGKFSCTYMKIKGCKEGKFSCTYMKIKGCINCPASLSVIAAAI